MEGSKDASPATCVHFLPILQLDIQRVPRRIYHISVVTYIGHLNQEIYLKLNSFGYCYQMKEAPNLVAMQLPYHFAFYCTNCRITVA